MCPILELSSAPRKLCDKHYAPIWKGQSEKPWPTLPVIKSKAVKTYDEFLSGVGDDKPDDVPTSEPIDEGDYTHHLDTVGELLDAVPITANDDAQLKEAAENIAPEKLMERLDAVADDESPDAEDVALLSSNIAKMMAARRAQRPGAAA